MKNHNCRRALGSASLPAGLRALAVAASLVLPAAAQDTKTDLPPGVTISVPAEASEEKTLRVNFRGVPLEMVLTELSTAAGYIIVVEPEAKGKLDTKIDVWSSQPVSQEEALTILNAALGRSGCAAIRNGRTLTVVTKEEAKKRDLPVRTGSNPAEIPKNDDMVTQILPVRFINAAQLTKDLQPLISDKATMTANESGNALVKRVPALAERLPGEQLETLKQLPSEAQKWGLLGVLAALALGTLGYHKPVLGKI